MDAYYKVIKKVPAATIVLTDTPQNILKRITSYDIDSRPMDKVLNETEKPLYLRDIKEDVSYFRRTWARARYHVDIAGLDVAESVEKLKRVLIPMRFHS
jgi:shikimate kinase